MSLRRLLLLALLLSIGSSSALTGYLSYRDSLIEANELFDAKLAQSARVLKLLAERHLDEGDVRPGTAVDVLDIQVPGEDDALATPDGHAYETKLAFQALAGDGRVMLRSANAPEQAMAPLRAGFGRIERGGEHWRSFALQAPSGRWYLVAERDDIRNELAAEIAVGSLLPPLLALPILAALIAVVVAWGTRAIGAVAAEVASRRPEQLAPIAPDSVPRELAGLIVAYNGLLGRVEDLLARERRFTADAAHELRTPISALKLHAQNLAASRDATQAQESLRGLLQGVDRGERLVRQLLELARLERGEAMSNLADLDLARLCREVAAEVATQAEAQHIEIQVEAPLRCVLRGDPVLLGVLLRNLLDNALRHAPPHSQVSLRLEESELAVLLAVIDQGPGIAPAHRARVFERFHREPGSPGEGSGLGLSIVARVAELHQASVELDDGEGGVGLCVRLRFARSPAHQRSR